MRGVDSRDVDVEDQGGVLFVSGDVLVTQRAAFIHSEPKVAGVSTFHASMRLVMLVSALAQPHKSAIWTLKAGSHIPEQLVVRRDPDDASHLLWGPRRRMELRAYDAALDSVGRDGTGALRDWKCWTDPLALLETLPIADADKKSLLAEADARLQQLRQRPLTPAAFLGRALLDHCLSSVHGGADMDYLTGLADLAAAVSEDAGMYESVAAACRRVNGLAGAAGSLAASPAAVLPMGMGARHFSTAVAPGRSSVLALAHWMGGVSGVQAHELQYMKAALLAARDELLDGVVALLDVEGEDYAAALEALEFQFELGRTAARELGFTRLWL